MGLEDIRISRRRLLVAGGSTAAALAVVGPTPLFAGTVACSAFPELANVSDIRYIVIDRRYPESLAHAEALAGRGATTLDVADGLTRLWQEHLQPFWRHGEGAVAGLTTLAVWQCLAEQARSHALRTRALAAVDRDDGHPDNLVSWTIA